MALPAELQPSLTPLELEFIACSHETVEIVPLFNMDRIRLISGVYGPFVPPKRIEVPLWLAVNLKLKAKCTIVPPEWLNPDRLKQKVDEELQTEDFSELPFRYLELAKVLLDVASDNIVSPDRIRFHLKNLREARQAKARGGLESLDRYEVDLPNLCAMEINEIRPYFIKAMGVIVHLQRDTKPADDNDMDVS